MERCRGEVLQTIQFSKIMKKLTFVATTLFLLVLAKSSFAQQQQQTSVPHAFKYQAVARNANGDAIANQNIAFRISIVQGSENGATVYQEIQTTTTNQFGLANLSIGRGTPTIGNFDSIQWGNGSYFVKIEFDPSGGTNYSLMSSSEMLSVPYSLYSENAGNVQGFPVKAALQATNLAAPLNNPETGMLVYNTESAGTAPNNVVPGYYYNAGTPEQPEWISLNSPSNKRRNSHSSDTTHTINPLIPGSNNTTYGGATRDGDGTCTAQTFGNSTSCPSGADNTGFGYAAFGTGTNPTGNDNTAVGYDVMSSTGTVTAAYNTAVGSQALVANTTANYNTAIGYEAMFTQSSTSASNSYNTAVGGLALYKNQSTGSGVGWENTGLGYEALYNNSTGNQNTAVGLQSSIWGSTGSNNTTMGYAALAWNTTGSNNTALGYKSIYGANTYSCSNNTAVGDSALYTNTTGANNTAVGNEAMYVNSTSNHLTVLGAQADVGLSTGLTYATAIGSGAIVSGSNCMALGGQTQTNYTYVGIGVAKPTAALEVADCYTVTTSATNNHIKSEGAQPSAATNYTGCTASTIIGSTDVVGNVGLSCTISTAGTITVSFTKSYNVAPIVVLTATDCGAANLAPYMYVTSSTTGFVIYIACGVNSSGTATYVNPAWNYHVIEPSN